MLLNSRIKGSVILLFTLFFITVLFSACKKEPGEGGSSKIIGKVYTRDYDPYFTFLEAEYWASDEDVYIIFGDGATGDFRVRTGPGGDFEFPYLRKGNYQIYVYSDDSTMTSQSGKVAVFKNVEITKNKQTVDVGTIVILKN
jgi:hypothetical protein